MTGLIDFDEIGFVDGQAWLGFTGSTGSCAGSNFDCVNPWGACFGQCSGLHSEHKIRSFKYSTVATSVQNSTVEETNRVLCDTTSAACSTHFHIDSYDSCRRPRHVGGESWNIEIKRVGYQDTGDASGRCAGYTALSSFAPLAITDLQTGRYKGEFPVSTSKYSSYSIRPSSRNTPTTPTVDFTTTVKGKHIVCANLNGAGADYVLGYFYVS